MVWPESVRPLWSVMVPEIITGRRSPSRSNTPSMAKMRRLRVERVEDRLDHEQVGAALDEGLGGLGVGGDQLVERDVAR